MKSSLYSPFQLQHPLSPRKFWKKMCEKIPVLILVAMLLGLVFWLGGALFFTEFLDVRPQTGSEGIILIGSAVGSFLFLIIISSVIYAIFTHFYIRLYFYNADENFLTIKKGVFAPTEIHVHYSKIQDVYVDQDFLDRLMGLYDVHIASATVTSGIEAHIDGVNYVTAEALKRFLLGKIIKDQSNVNQKTGEYVIEDAQKNIGLAKEVDIIPPHDISSETFPLVPRSIVTDVISSVILYHIMFWVPALFLGTVIEGAFRVELFPTILSLFEENIFSAGLKFIVSIFVILLILSIVITILQRRFLSFSFGKNYIVFNEGIIFRSSVTMHYKTIQNVSVNQTTFERPLGIAQVSIENASGVEGSITIPGQPLAKANELADIIRTIMLKHKDHSTGV